MTAADFRRLALALLEAVEGSHMGHADFRVRGKIFATLGPDESWGMVKLPPVEQARLVHAEPEVWEPGKGAWGRGGATLVRLARARRTTVKAALESAWRNVAPKTLVRRFDEE